MSIINTRKKILLNVPNIKENSLQKKISNLISLLTILFLSCVIVILSVLIFNLANKIYNSKDYTVTYTGASIDEESSVFRVNL